MIVTLTTPPSAATPPPEAAPPRRRSRWLHTLSRTLHIYLTLIALVLLLLFSATGFLLNHPDWFTLDDGSVTTAAAAIPAEVLPDRLLLVEHLRKHQLAAGELTAMDADDDVIRLQFASPSRKVDITITAATGEAEVTTTHYSVLSILGDLHTGKRTAAPWKRLIDVTAILLFLGSVSGLILFFAVPRRRMVGVACLVAGVAVPLVMYLLM